MRYRFWLICINYNFDFLVLYKMYFQNYFARRSIILESFTSHLQHSRPCCIRYTNSRLRLEFVYLIQHGRSCCKYYIQNLQNMRGCIFRILQHFATKLCILLTYSIAALSSCCDGFCSFCLDHNLVYS